MRRLLLILIACCGLFAVMSLPAAGITNGRPDGDAHPYVGAVYFEAGGEMLYVCSGSLLSPTLVLTAAHCASQADAARVSFDEEVVPTEEFPGPGRTAYAGTPVVHPGFELLFGPGLPGFMRRDVAVVQLSQEVPTSVVSRYALLPEAGLVDRLANKTRVDVVGYGVTTRTTGGGPPVWIGNGSRQWATSQLVSGNFASAAEQLKLTANPGGGTGGIALGDSGGPNLLGGTDVVLGTNSFGTNGNFAGVSYSQRVDIPDVLTWLASQL